MSARIPLHALTLHRPWPWALTFGGKTIENRGWAPPDWQVGRFLAIHAGKAWNQDGADRIKQLAPQLPGSSADHPLGIVAVVRVIGVIEQVEQKRLVAWWSDAPSTAHPNMRWFTGPFGWIVDSAVAIHPPVACRGQQGLWPVPTEALALVRERWKAARDDANR